MGGSTNNKKDSAGRRLGLKKWGHTEEIFEGDILARQRGHKWHPGIHVRSGKDHTLHSKVEVSSLSSAKIYLLLGFNRMEPRQIHEETAQASACGPYGAS